MKSGILSAIRKVGQVELLTDRVMRPFKLLKGNMTEYRLNPDPKLKQAIRNEFKRYLDRLNDNKRIPLSYRLEVMDFVSDHIDLLDEMAISSVMDSYQIAITLLDEELDKEPSLKNPMLELASIAMRLATNNLCRTLQRYSTVSVASMRQTLSIMNLVLRSDHQLDEEGAEWLEKICQNFALHEIMRSMRTNAMSVEDQKIVIHELQKHMDSGYLAEVQLCEKGAPMDSIGLSFLTNPQAPHSPPEKSIRSRGMADQDTIIINLDTLLNKTIEEMKNAESTMKRMSTRNHKEYALISTFVHNAVTTGSAMVDLMREKKRQYPRTPPQNNLFVAVDANLENALPYLYEMQKKQKLQAQTPRPAIDQMWQVVDVSDGGFCLEKLPAADKASSATGSPALEVGMLISLEINTMAAGDRSAGSDQANQESILGLIRWYVVNDNGLESLGISRLHQGRLVSVKAATKLYAFMDETDPELARMWSTQEKLETGSRLRVQSTGSSTPADYKVVKMEKSGANYVVHACKAVS